MEQEDRHEALELPPPGDNGRPAPYLDRGRVKAVIETVLFLAHEPVTVRELSAVVFRGESGAGAPLIRELLSELVEEYRGRALQLEEVAEGYRLFSRPEYSFWVRRYLRRERRPRLSQAALETLAIIAYKQPITRPEIEALRGVDVSGVLKTLLERELIRPIGRRNVVGRPLVYGTTRGFLEHFGLRSLSDLPKPEELSLQSPGPGALSLEELSGP